MSKIQHSKTKRIDPKMSNTVASCPTKNPSKQDLQHQQKKDDALCRHFNSNDPHTFRQMQHNIRSLCEMTVPYIYEDMSEKLEIQNYFKHAKKLKVTVFAKRFAKFYKLLHAYPVIDGGFHIRKLLNEYITEINHKFNLFKPLLSTEQMVDLLISKICAGLQETVEGDKLKQSFVNFLSGNKVRQLLLNGAIAPLQNEHNKKHFMSFQEHVSTAYRLGLQFGYIVFMEMNKDKHVKMCLKEFATAVIVVHYALKSLTYQSVNEIQNMLQEKFKLDMFLVRFVGRKCENCAQRESRKIDNIEFFRICPCGMYHYCGKLCQKIHWKAKHRFECGRISHRVQCN